ncbi:DUF4332 domain-containing protein [Membranicola marinus]|uniref:DUF4332 domain-containing protein n=1 Tax=Membranihabitans marinus TaxID=1227546 RepID=A0A953HYG6_9BACT|nr:helix-hairpin-helix domain-containing protein [Membranihabitans marinus]MBY5958037.1 DUF4332 domain-containing protein [Membranihabitans marinus]
MVFFISMFSLMFGSPFGIIVFGAGVIVGYLVSENKRKSAAELDQAYDEMNNMLLEREGRIDELEDYIDQLLGQGKHSTPAGEDDAPTLPKKETAENAGQKDDLTRIEGIGPKTAEVLYQSGIVTYKALSETSLDALKQILEDAGTVYLRHGHETWAKQALLAANDEWEALEAWQGKN